MNTYIMTTPIRNVDIHETFDYPTSIPKWRKANCKAYDTYRESNRGADNISGNVSLKRTKPHLRALHGEYTVTYRDKELSIIITSKALIMRPNFTNVRAGEFAMEYTYEDGRGRSHVRNIARFIPTTDSECMELQLKGLINNIDKQLALDIAKDVVHFLTNTPLHKPIIDSLKSEGTYEYYNQ